jgi:hypothetical protein
LMTAWGDIRLGTRTWSVYRSLACDSHLLKVLIVNTTLFSTRKQMQEAGVHYCSDHRQRTLPNCILVTTSRRVSRQWRMDFDSTSFGPGDRGL